VEAFCVRAIRRPRKRQHTVDIAVPLDWAAFAASRATWLHHDLLDERTDRLPNNCCVIGCKMHIALGDRADVQRSIVGRQANNLRWSRRCYYLFEAVFVGSKFDKRSPGFRTVRRRHCLH
jgi:hypothetical protein